MRGPLRNGSAAKPQFIKETFVDDVGDSLTKFRPPAKELLEIQAQALQLHFKENQRLEYAKQEGPAFCQTLPGSATRADEEANVATQAKGQSAFLWQNEAKGLELLVPSLMIGADFAEFPGQAAKPKAKALPVSQVLRTCLSLMDANKYKELLEYANKQDLQHSDLFYMKGEACRRLQQLDAAEAALQKALKFACYNFNVDYSIGLVYLAKDKASSALPHLKRFLINKVSPCVSQPLNDKANFHVGRCYARLAMFEQALKAFSNAIQLNPSVAIYYLHRADSYESVGCPAQAQKDVATFKALVPDFETKFQAELSQLQSTGQRGQHDLLSKYFQRIRRS